MIFNKPTKEKKPLTNLYIGKIDTGKANEIFGTYFSYAVICWTTSKNIVAENCIGMFIFSMIRCLVVSARLGIKVAGSFWVTYRVRGLSRFRVRMKVFFSME